MKKKSKIKNNIIFCIISLFFYVSLWIISTLCPIVSDYIFQHIYQYHILHTMFLFLFGIYLPYGIVIMLISRKKIIYGSGIAAVISYIAFMIPILLNSMEIARGLEIKSKTYAFLIFFISTIIFYLIGYYGEREKYCEGNKKNNKIPV